MKNYFVPYELALRLKQLGFIECCLAYYREDAVVNGDSVYEYISPSEFEEVKNSPYMIPVFAPTYQQVLDWLRDEYKICIWIERISPSERFYIQCPQLTDANIKFNRWCDDYYEAFNKAINEAIKLIPNDIKEN